MIQLKVTPAKDVRDEVRDIFVKNAADNDVHLTKSQATEIVNDVIKNVEKHTNSNQSST